MASPVLAEDTPDDDEEIAEEQDAEDDEAPEDDMHAEDPAHTLDMPHCAFTATFPEQPYTTKRCTQPKAQDLSGGRECYDVATYTQVYDMTTTVSISMSCNQSSKHAYEQYDEGVMRAVLEGMAGRNALNDTSIGYKDLGDVHMAALSGTGQTGRQHQIYIAQLWVSEGSILSVEAQLIGEGRPDADKTFTEILRSIHIKE